jgi:hypothetical protein
MLAVSAFQAYGQYEQGKTQSEIEENKAKALEYQAQSVAETSSINEMRQNDVTKQQIAKARAIAGASGADVNSQSTLKSIEQMAVVGAEAALDIRTQGLQQAWGIGQQAKAQRYTAKAVKQQAAWTAAGTALTGATKAGSMQGGWWT